MTLQHLPASSSVEDIVACLREHGHVIIDELVSPSVMEQAEAELLPYLDAAEFGPHVGLGLLTKRTGGLIGRSPAVRQLVMNDKVLGAAKAFLSHASAVHVSLTETIFLSPGSPAQVIHQDELTYDGFDFKDYDVQMSTLWAMSDYTAEMGATLVVPESHKLGRGKDFKPADAESAEMKRGSVILYSGKIYHGSGENKSDRVRKAVNINYAVAWLRQEENQYLSCPPEVARTLPEELLRLMGYSCTAAAGYVIDRKEPLSILLPEFVGAPAIHPMVPGGSALDIMADDKPAGADAAQAK